MINPLDLHGPEFLVFYVAVGILTLLFGRIWFKHQGSQSAVPRLNLTDPYEIALLRGGENEAIGVAALSLVDRGLLSISEDELQTKNRSAVDHARRPIEKAILSKYLLPGKAHSMYTDKFLIDACAEYRTALSQHSLIANDAVFEARRPILWLGLFILVGLAGAKVFVALQRSRPNIMFLNILTVAFVFLLFKFYKEERTGLGDRVPPMSG